MLTPAQITERRAVLGGSDIARIATNKFGGLPAVVLSKRGGEPVNTISDEESLIIEHGNWSETPGLDWLAGQLGFPSPEVIRRGVRAIDSRPGSHLACNLDGIIALRNVADNSELPLIPCEHKYVSPYTEEDWLTGPNDYSVMQVHTEMLCCNAEKAYVVATVNYKHRAFWEVRRDQRLCDAIDKLQAYVWDKLVAAAEMPAVDFTELPQYVTGQSLRDLLNAATITLGKVTKLTDKDAETIKLWTIAKRAARGFTTGAEALRDWLLFRLGDSQYGELPDGRRIERKKKLRKAYSVDASEYYELIEPKGDKSDE